MREFVYKKSIDTLVTQDSEAFCVTINGIVKSDGKGINDSD